MLSDEKPEQISAFSDETGTVNFRIRRLEADLIFAKPAENEPVKIFVFSRTTKAGNPAPDLLKNVAKNALSVLVRTTALNGYKSAFVRKKTDKSGKPAGKTGVFGEIIAKNAAGDLISAHYKAGKMYLSAHDSAGELRQHQDFTEEFPHFFEPKVGPHKTAKTAFKIQKIICLSDGMLVLGVHRDGSSSHRDFVFSILKISPSFEVIWRKKLAFLPNYKHWSINDLQVFKGGEIYVSGETETGRSPGELLQNRRPFVQKISPGGQLLWNPFYQTLAHRFVSGIRLLEGKDGPVLFYAGRKSKAENYPGLSARKIASVRTFGTFGFLNSSVRFQKK